MKKCYYCHRLLTQSIKTKDHVIPKSKLIFKNVKNNKVYACKPCNSAKADLSLEEFKKTGYYKFFCERKWRSSRNSLKIF